MSLYRQITSEQTNNDYCSTFSFETSCSTYAASISRQSSHQCSEINSCSAISCVGGLELSRDPCLAEMAVTFHDQSQLYGQGDHTDNLTPMLQLKLNFRDQWMCNNSMFTQGTFALYSFGQPFVNNVDFTLISATGSCSNATIKPSCLLPGHACSSGTSAITWDSTPFVQTLKLIACIVSGIVVAILVIGVLTYLIRKRIRHNASRGQQTLVFSSSTQSLDNLSSV